MTQSFLPYLEKFSADITKAFKLKFDFNLRESRWAKKMKMLKKNRLLQKGALVFPHPFKEPPVKLPDWMKEKAASLPSQPIQPDLF